MPAGSASLNVWQITFEHGHIYIYIQFTFLLYQSAVYLFILVFIQTLRQTVCVYFYFYFFRNENLQVCQILREFPKFQKHIYLWDLCVFLTQRAKKQRPRENVCVYNTIQLYCFCVEKSAFWLVIYIKTFSTVNNKTSTAQWNTELKTAQIQGILNNNNVHTHACTHPPTHTHTHTYSSSGSPVT